MFHPCNMLWRAIAARAERHRQQAVAGSMAMVDE
jgi:hypothetical protein